MKRTYQHDIQTGSGRTRVNITFPETGQAIIEFDLRWMVPGVKRYRLHCSHRPFSETYGLLQLQSIERYTSLVEDTKVREQITDFIDDPDISSDDEVRDFYNQVTFEYIKLPQSEPWIGDDPGLEDMRALGWAQWNSRFDLILLLHFSVAMEEHKIEGTDIAYVLSSLDKMKFSTVLE